MNKRIKRLISLLLTLSMLLGLLMVSAQAATEQNGSQESSQASVELIFEYPKDVPKDEVKLSVFQGIPQWRQKNDAKTIEDVPEVLTNPTNPNYPKLKEILPDKDGKYIVNEAGGYCYFVRGKEPSEYYNIIKLFLVTEEDLKAGTKNIPVKTGPSAGTGFETGNNNPVGENGETAPDGFNQGVQHLVPIEGTDEMEHLAGYGRAGLDMSPLPTPGVPGGAGHVSGHYPERNDGIHPGIRGAVPVYARIQCRKDRKSGL